MQRRTTVLPARLSHLRLLQAFVEAFCNESRLTDSFTKWLNLVIEELFTNVVKHGHGSDCDSPVWVSLTCSGDIVRIVLEDTAPAFNPFAKPVSDESPAETRRVGGLGIKLTRAITLSAEYAYVFGRNHLSMSMQADSRA